MSYEPIDVDRSGLATLILPDIDEINIRPLAGGPDEFVMSLCSLPSYPSYLWLRGLRYKIDRALNEYEGEVA